MSGHRMPRAGTACEGCKASGVLGSRRSDRCELSGLAVRPWGSWRESLHAGLRAAESHVYKLEI